MEWKQARAMQAISEAISSRATVLCVCEGRGGGSIARRSWVNRCVGIKVALEMGIYL